MKRRMAARDGEYKESNRFLRAVMGIIVVVAVILSLESWLLLNTIS